MIKIDGKTYKFKAGEMEMYTRGFFTAGISCTTDRHSNKIEVHEQNKDRAKAEAVCEKLRDEILARINTELVPVYQRQVVPSSLAWAWSDCTHGEYKRAAGLDGVETRILYKKVSDDE